MRIAASRSITTLACGAVRSWSEVTSVTAVTVRSLSSSASVHCRNSPRSEPSNTYWLEAPPRPPARKSCAAYRNVCTPPICASCGRNRLMIASAPTPWRSAIGFSPMVNCPRFSDAQPELTPMVEPTLATAGSRNSTSTTARCRSAIAAKLTSGPASVPPCSNPIS